MTGPVNRSDEPRAQIFMDQTWKLNIQSEMSGDVLVLAVSGRLGTDAAGGFLEALLSVLLEGHRRILVDLEGVDYVSSAGLTVLAAVAGRAHADAASLILCGLREPVRLVFELAGLLPEFTVVRTRSDALGRFGQ